MEQFVDEGFYTRADSFIDLANENVRDTERNLVSGSMMYASARFNAWIIGEVHVLNRKIVPNGRRDHFEQTTAFENLQSNINNFGDYMQPDA